MVEGLSAKVKLLKDVREFRLLVCVTRDWHTDLYDLLFWTTSSRSADCWFSNYVEVDHDRDWQRSARIHSTAEPNGASARSSNRLSHLFNKHAHSPYPFSPISIHLLPYAVHILTLTCTATNSERRLRRNIRHPLRHISSYEQHGLQARLPLALVHSLPHHRLLVLPRRMVVSTVIRSVPYHTKPRSASPCNLYLNRPSAQHHIPPKISFGRSPYYAYRIVFYQTCLLPCILDFTDHSFITVLSNLALGLSQSQYDARRM